MVLGLQDTCDLPPAHRTQDSQGGPARTKSAESFAAKDGGPEFRSLARCRTRTQAYDLPADYPEWEGELIILMQVAHRQSTLAKQSVRIWLDMVMW